MQYIITILAIIGVIFNICKSPVGFYIWTVTNAYWTIYNYKKREYAQAILFAVFIVVSVYGAYVWSFN